MTDVAYCTREQVRSALDQADTYRTNARIDAAIQAGARQVEAVTHRKFYPTTCTRYPELRFVTGPVLWLDQDYLEMISVSSFSADGVTYTEGDDFFLRPDSGPPYTSLKLINLSDAAFSSDDRGMILAGEQGASGTTRAAGALVGAFTASDTAIVVSDSSLVGVGDLLTIGTERLNVTGKLFTTSVTTITADVAASAATRSITVADGTLLHAGEQIMLGTERLFVESITGNVVTVRRAELGSQLGAHTNGDTVYAARLCVVERGATGTTAATHADGASIRANSPPPLVKECNLAYALVDLTQSQAAYGRVIGAGDNQRESSGRGLQQIVDDLIANHGRLRLGTA
jgi:hypothetical protein